MIIRLFLIFVFLLPVFALDNKVAYTKEFEKSINVYPTKNLVNFLNSSKNIDRVKLPVLIEFFGPAIKGAFISTSFNNYNSNIISIDMTRISIDPFSKLKSVCGDLDKCILWLSGNFENSTLILRDIHEKLNDDFHEKNINIYITKK